MELLDLTRHDPEEYCGKALRCHGAEYLIGPHLGTGADRIVHRLINRRSGLDLLVVKIVRKGWPRGFATSVLAKLRAQPFLREVVPVTHEVDVPGGIVEFQLNVDGGLPMGDSVSGEISAALEALRRDDFRLAVAHGEAALRLHPTNTMAMINLAAAVHALGDLERAMTLARQAVEIEPNFLLYHSALVRYTGNAGFPRLALGDFGQFLKIFTHVYDLHETAITLQLFCGEPEAAKELLANAVVDDATRVSISEQIALELAAKAKAGASLVRAKANVEQRAWQAAMADLERGRAIYAKDSMLNVNHALAIARAGEPLRAAGLLIGAAQVAPDWCAPFCWANAAFCLIDAGNLEAALVTLEALATLLTARHQGWIPTTSDDLPGVAIWIGSTQCIEERLHTATERIERGLKYEQGRRHHPATLLELERAYRQASFQDGQ